MKKGLSDAVFIPDWDTGKFLSEAKKAGFEGVELNIREAEGDLTLNTAPAEARAVARMAEELDLELPTLTTGLLNHYSLSSGDHALRARGEEIASHMIEIASEMGTKVVQLVPGVVTTETCYDEAYSLAQETLSRLATRASSCNVTIAIENVCNKFLPSALEFTRFLDEINHPSLQAYFDNGNALVTGFPEHYVSLLGTRIVAMHLKDYRANAGDFVPILEGDTNWPVMMKAINDIPYTGYVIATPPYKYACGACLEHLVNSTSANLTAIFALTENQIIQ
ncbi:hexulose-6-phosphate isomerase [Scopulibacillus darangshiensis]|uniref:Hexulose-6-phosphate isomerase n=1 Tax=Scopulibacillus darangshiensis TaxID=442528 RepID=A0A4R2NKH9_9BACL|nr:sugar phosphate isomerase/epimerase family protein [Scopulibacillus darangshiensis]TCP21674.1 hexulose-6-phosphate isomerase [Scopulibacillus darangshiensis]